MKSLKKLPNYILTWAIALIVIATLMAITSPKLRSSGQQQETEQSAQVPKVISKIKDLEVISTTLDKQDKATPVLVIEILNNSVKPIVAISIESGDEKDSSGISTDGFKGGDDPPTIILPPHGTIKMKMPVSNLLPGKPLKVSGVMYADGTDDGEYLAKKRLRGHRERTKAKGSAEKGEPQQ